MKTSVLYFLTSLGAVSALSSLATIAPTTTQPACQNTALVASPKLYGTIAPEVLAASQISVAWHGPSPSAVTTVTMYNLGPYGSNCDGEPFYIGPTRAAGLPSYDITATWYQAGEAFDTVTIPVSTATCGLNTATITGSYVSTTTF